MAVFLKTAYLQQTIIGYKNPLKSGSEPAGIHQAFHPDRCASERTARQPGF